LANILVQIELADEEPTPASLSLINEGRTIASRLGATLYAMLPCDQPPTYGDNDIIAVLSRHGADKVILLTHPDLGGEVTAEQLHATLRLACKRFPPRLVLLPSTEENMQIAASLALYLQGQFTGMDSLGFTPEERTPYFKELTGGEPGDDLPEGMRILVECEGALVMTLAPEDPPTAMGDEEAEVVVLHPRLPGDPVEPEEAETADDIRSDALDAMGEFASDAVTGDAPVMVVIDPEDPTPDPRPTAEGDPEPDPEQ